jgi:thiamine-phosphate diphosphorylase
VSRPPVPRLVVIVDRETSASPVVSVVQAVLAGGADQIQIREPDLDETGMSGLLNEIFHAGLDLSRITVNGWPSLAERYRVNLHLPESRADLAHAYANETRLLSRSVHGKISAAQAESFDYLIAGNVLETSSHPGRTGLGADGFAAIATASPVPVLAIGGMTPQSIGPFIAAGAFGAAVRSYVTGSADPEAATREIREEIAKWTK